MFSRLFLSLTLLSPLVGALGCAHQPAGHTNAAPVLPLEKVRLYESGVGYFERAGQLDGRGAALPVPSAHLDDAIKSLVVLSRDGSIEDISFASRLSPAVARARAGLPPDADEEVDLAAVLETLQGSGVALRIGREQVRGRLVDVHRVSPGDIGYRDPVPVAAAKDDEPSSQQPPRSPQLHLTLLTDDGTFRRFDTAEVDGIRPLDPDRRRRYEAALEAASSSGNQDATTMTLDASVDGPVRIGYLAEAPLWRTTYRLVFAKDAEATLQGWALVHNDTDESWHAISLELVNGRPDSFLFPLAAPRYERRHLETPPKELSSIPQLLVTTPDAQWGDFADTWGGLSGGGGSGYGHGSGAGFGGRGKRVPKIRQARARVGAGSSDLINLGDLAKVAGATGEETETVFIYRARRPLDLGPHRSALVPFLHESIEASPIVRFGSMQHEARHAVRIVNNTRKTLPPGPVSMFADGGFMGETTLNRLKPGERQFSEIGDDPDTELERSDFMFEEHARYVVFRNDSVERHYLRTDRHQLVFKNRSGREREVHLVLDVGRNASVEGADGIDFDSTTQQPLAIFRVPPGTSPTRTLVVKRGLKMGSGLDSIDEETLRNLAGLDEIAAATRSVLTAAAGQAKVREDARAKVRELASDIETVSGDLERLREHLKALGDGEKGASKPLLTRLLETEDRLQQLRQQHAAAEKAAGREQEKLRTQLQALGETAPQTSAPESTSTSR